MATKKFLPIEDVNLAKEKLKQMPDLNKQRMTHRQALDEMKEELLELALNKGYKISEIKLVLEELGISVNVKNINDVISENKKQKKSRKSNKKTTIPDEKINTQGSSEMIAPQNNPY